jgi:hypothetical protein
MLRPLKTVLKDRTVSMETTMRMEVHVHGTAFLCKGVHLSQIEDALRPWLDYLEVDAIAKVQSMEREEPGIQFDPKEQALDMCWTGEVGRSFNHRLKDAFNALGPLTDYASEITVTYYQDNGKEEFQQVFIGPSPEAIHEIRRQCVEEDLIGLMSAHFDKGRVDQVVGIVNQMFDEDWKSRPATDKQTAAAPALSPHPRNRHLH